MRQGLLFPKWAWGSERRNTKQRQSTLGLSSYHRRLLCEALEDRRLLGILSVPYIQQCYDTATGFDGRWACAPTSAVMVLAHYSRIPANPITAPAYGNTPAHTNDYSSYVSNQYTYGSTTFSQSAADTSGHSAKGAYGYIWQNGVGGVYSNLLNYFQLHDFSTTFFAQPSAATAQAIVQGQIDAGKPLIARTYLTGEPPTGSGHYVVVVGYQWVGSTFEYVVNDPFGAYPYNSGYDNRYGESSPWEVSEPRVYTYEQLDLGYSDGTRGLITIGSTSTATSPTVVTQTATGVGSTSATLNAQISSTGGGTITERRFSWGTTSSCSDGWTNAVTVNGSNFSYTLTGLTPGQTYYFQAWADNSAGWSMGSALSFTAMNQTSYDRQAAFNYAQKYAFYVVSDGMFFEQSYPASDLGAMTPVPTATGYDCAHFVSGCIGAEPHEEGGGLAVPSRAGVYGEPGANALQQWLVSSENAVYKTSVAELEMGDVISYDFDGDGISNHVVLYLGGGKVASHSNSYWNIDWNDYTYQDVRYVHILSDTTPPGNVGSFTATPGNGQVSLTWSNPADVDYAGVEIIRKTGSYPTNRTDGTSIYNGNGTSTADTELANGTTYYYKAFTYDGEPNYSSGVTASATPQASSDNTPPRINSLSASPNPVPRNGILTLTANGVTDPDGDGTVMAVHFYLDVNGNGSLEPETDSLLNSDVKGDDGWAWVGSPYYFPVGVNTYMARVQDDHYTFSMTVTTTGTVGPLPAAEIVVEGNGQNIMDGDTLPSLTDGTDFGSVVQGGAAVSRTFTVRNTGMGVLSLGTPEVPAGFALSEPLKRNIDPGSSDTFTVQLSTATVGTFTGDISVINSDSDEDPFNFSIAGTVIPKLPGDVNRDGRVDKTDASILAAHWLMRTGATWGDGDFNEDGKVDDLDLAILAANWRDEAPPVVATGSNEPQGGSAGDAVETPSDLRFIGPRQIPPSGTMVSRPVPLRLNRSIGAALPSVRTEATSAPVQAEPESAPVQAGGQAVAVPEENKPVRAVASVAQSRPVRAAHDAALIEACRVYGPMAWVYQFEPQRAARPLKLQRMPWQMVDFVLTAN